MARLVLGPLEVHLLLEKAHEDADSLVAGRFGLTVVACKAPGVSGMSEVGVSSREDKLAPFVVIERVISITIIFVDNIGAVSLTSTDVVLVEELGQLVSLDGAVRIGVNLLERLHGAEVWVESKVLTSQFDL